MSQAADKRETGRLRPLRVGLVAGPGTLGRLGPVVRHMVVGLLDEPMHVTMICPHGPAPDVPAPPVHVVRYAPARLSIFRNRAADALAEALSSGSDISLLHALDAGAAPMTRKLAIRLDVYYLLSIMGLRRDLSAADDRCRGVLPASEPVLRMILDGRLAAAERVRLVRPGIHQVRKATCFIDPKHAPAIVAAGPLDHAPFFSAVLEAFARLQQDERGCAFFVVGGGRAERSLRRHAEKLGLMGELSFVERQAPEQLTNILKAADVFISPVPSSEMQIELLSAMAAGVPVLAAGAEASDFIVPDRTALTFEAGSADQLAEGLTKLLEDRAAARALAENALDHLKEHHSPARMAAALAGTYRCVRKGAPLPE